MKAVVFLLVFVCAATLGADQAWFRLTGFSEDGQFVLWETGGVQDGSGFPWVRMEVVNVETSLPEESVYLVWEDPESIQPDFSVAENTVADLCREFWIKPGNTGSLLLYHPVTDLCVSPDTVVFCLEQYCPGFNSGEIVLVLKNTPADMQEGYPDWFPQPVSLSIETDSLLFFHEDELAEGYEAVFGYSFAGVYRNPAVTNSLLVVLHATKPGFEGPDGRFRVVTGTVI